MPCALAHARARGVCSCAALEGRRGRATAEGVRAVHTQARGVAQSTAPRTHLCMTSPVCLPTHVHAQLTEGMAQIKKDLETTTPTTSTTTTTTTTTATSTTTTTTTATTTTTTTTTPTIEAPVGSTIFPLKGEVHQTAHGLPHGAVCTVCNNRVVVRANSSVAVGVGTGERRRERAACGTCTSPVCRGLLSVRLAGRAQVTLIKGWVQKDFKEFKGHTVELERCYSRSQELEKTGKATTQAFHAACDGKGATVAVVRTKEGHIFGGAADVSQAGAAQPYWTASDAAFLFCVSCAGAKGKAPFQLKLNGRKNQYAVQHWSQDGPVFGGGHDLQITERAHPGPFSTLGESYTCPVGVYSDKACTEYLAGGAKPGRLFDLADYEVFVVKAKFESALFSSSAVAAVKGWVQKDFEAFNGKAVHLVRCYSMARSGDGGSSAGFHAACDGKGETVTIVKTTTGHTFGGAADRAWDSSSGWVSSKSSFLFCISCAGKKGAAPFQIKFNVNNKNGEELYLGSGNGPTFGHNSDLYVLSVVEPKVHQTSFEWALPP